MKELVASNHCGNMTTILKKIISRINVKNVSSYKIANLNNLYYEIMQKETFTCCIITLSNNEIVGIGITKRNRMDKHNPDIAEKVCIQRAIKDYLSGTKFNTFP